MTKEELSLELLKLSTQEFSRDNAPSKENIVSAYNYIYNNIAATDKQPDKE